MSDALIRYVQRSAWDTSSFVPVPAAVAAYTGPGDIVTGAQAFWGFFGYNAAYATGSNPCCDLVDQAGANPITLNILSSGSVDTIGLANWVTAHSVTTIKVKRLYDQTGNGQHMTQATLANMPPLTQNSVSTFPCMTPDQATFFILQATAAATIPAGVKSFTMAASYTGVNGQWSFVWENDTAGTNQVDVAFAFSNSSVMTTAGASLSSSVSDNNFHAVSIAYDNSSNAVIRVDTTEDSGGVGGNTITSGDNMSLLAFVSGARLYKGQFGEFGIWPSQFNGTQRANMNSNIHTRWNF